MKIGEAYYNFHYNRSESRAMPLIESTVSSTDLALRAVSSTGRAFGLHPKGHRFEPYTAHFPPFEAISAREALAGIPNHSRGGQRERASVPAAGVLAGITGRRTLYRQTRGGRGV